MFVIPSLKFDATGLVWKIPVFIVFSVAFAFSAIFLYRLLDTLSLSQVQLFFIGIPVGILYCGEFALLFLTNAGSPSQSPIRKTFDDHIWNLVFDNTLPVPPERLRTQLLDIAEQLWNSVNFTPPSLNPEDPNTPHFQFLWTNANFYVSKAIYAFIETYIRALPKFASSAFTIPITEVINPANIIFNLIEPFRSPELKQLGLLQDIPFQFNENVKHATGQQQSYELLYPQNFRGTSLEVINMYLANIPFHNLFNIQVPFQLDDAKRFEHQWIIGSSGHGKTQCIQTMIAHDLERVKKGECSIVILDSQNEMIPKIAGLQMFAENPDKLILIDPKGLCPPAINLFSFEGGDDLKKLYHFIFSSLLNSEMTDNQKTLFDASIALLRHVPNATVRNFHALLREKKEDKLASYTQYIKKLDEYDQEFFNEDYFSKGADSYTANKLQVLKRINTLLRTSPFKEMLSCTENKLDLFSELEHGKVVLVNTAKLGDDTRTFGRFFLALIANVMRQRNDEKKHLPCFVYIDECQQYVKDDPTTIDLLAMARKTNIGLIFAHRWIDELGERVPKALESITSVIFAGGLRANDASFMSRVMECDPALLKQQRKGLFAAYVRGRPISQISVPFGTLEKLPTMSRADLQKMRERMKEQYGAEEPALLPTLSPIEVEDVDASKDPYG